MRDGLSEKEFRKYEPYIGMIIEKYPAPVIFEARDRSPNTVCARLRDAMKGWLTYNYPSNLSIERFSQIRDTLYIAVQDNKIVVSCKESNVSLDNLSLADITAAKVNIAFLVDLPKESKELHDCTIACAVLADAGVFSKPIGFKNFDVNQPLEDFNVTVWYEDKIKLYLML